MHCPAFSVPLLDFGNDNDSYDSLGDMPASIAKAKHKWKEIAKIIFCEQPKIPLKQMAWKAKHQDIIFEQM